jgi:hypothetical protein
LFPAPSPPPPPGWILLGFDINFSNARIRPSFLCVRSSFWGGQRSRLAALLHSESVSFTPLPPLCNFLHSWRKCRSRLRCLLVPTSW